MTKCWGLFKGSKLYVGPDVKSIRLHFSHKKPKRGMVLGLCRLCHSALSACVWRGCSGWVSSPWVGTGSEFCAQAGLVGSGAESKRADFLLTRGQPWPGFWEFDGSASIQHSFRADNSAFCFEWFCFNEPGRVHYPDPSHPSRTILMENLLSE